MILRKGMKVLVDKSKTGHSPTRPYIITEIWDDSVFLEGLWDLIKSSPRHVPKDCLWPILDPGEKVKVNLAPSSPLDDSHINHAGIWTVHRTAMYGEFLCFNSIDELPCIVWMNEISAAFDTRFLEEVGLEETVFTPDKLRIANTKLGASTCVACGGPLKIPTGLGSEYQYCPKCEP